MNASPTAPTLDVTRLGASLATGLTFATVSPATGYGTSAAGPGELTIRNGAVTLFNAQAPLVRDSSTTVVALGTSDPLILPGSPRSFQPIALKDTAATPTAGAW
ncbi:MAG: DUF4397 domain-containing protein, partial [Cryobacterium sp.]|nr:DUF4397 domain-containing protein [Cryobacterium sp.]